MHRRQWDAYTKARIVLKALKGKPIGEICNKHWTSQSLNYQ